MASEPEVSTPFSLNRAPPPPMMSYEDDSGTLHEIFVPSGRYEEAVRLYRKRDWKALSDFPRWSDCPALQPVEPDSMTYVPGKSSGDGPGRTIYLPKGTAERARILLVNEDWTALKNEFEAFDAQRFKRPEAEIEHAWGVERIRKAREDQEALQR